MKVCVVGAGIAGLTTALFLCRSGFEVHIYERHHCLSEVGAGVQITSNALKLLAKLDLLPQILASAFQPRGINIRRYENGDILQQLPGSHITEAIFGAKHVLIHRPSYQQILYDANIAAGVTVLFGAQIVSIDSEPPLIRLKEVGPVPYDLLIGADGVNSLIRRSIHGRAAQNCIVHPYELFRALIPAGTMSKTPYGQILMDSSVINVWIGPNRHIVGYSISKDFYNVVMDYPNSTSSHGSWNTPGSVEKMRAIFTDFDPQLRSILDLVDDLGTWSMLETPELTSWASPNGKVVLVGDAAHAMLPHAAQGAAQAVEDAAVLATCLQHFDVSKDIKWATDVYYALRKPRVDRVMASARSNAQLWRMQDGPEQRQRDLRWKEMAERRSMDNTAGQANRFGDDIDVMIAKQTESAQWLFSTEVDNDAKAYLENLKV